MYLASVKIKNFRRFDENEHIVNFNSGLTVLVGENDSGKSAIIDAIRIVLGTTDLSWNHIKTSDFHNEDTSRDIEITCVFKDLTEDEKGIFLEYLTFEEVNEIRVPVLYVKWQCSYSMNFNSPRTIVVTNTGKNSDGPALNVLAKEYLRVTYLRPLRDAYTDMQAGKKSRLAQIINRLENINSGKDVYVKGDSVEELSLVGIADLLNKLLTEHPKLKEVNSKLVNLLHEAMLLKNDQLTTKFEVSNASISDEQKISRLLEKLDLSVDKDNCYMAGDVGLGTSNIMSMACEMLLHRDNNTNNRFSFLLIEEPEAHIHAQRQLKLIQSLEKTINNSNQQIILTTHSPLLASIVSLKNLIVVKDGKIYPMGSEYTKLDEADYKYLERYLDATKANLFFARSVIIVEGPGEALLLPTLAKLLGRSFTDYGTSLVDVRSTGLRRYARIFQRQDETELLDVNVACVTDLDIMPNCAPRICFTKKGYKDDASNWPEKDNRRWRTFKDISDEGLSLDDKFREIGEKATGQNVKTFIANQWTLEYNLAFCGLCDDKMREVLIDSLIAVAYEPQNREAKTKELVEELSSYENIEEKASIFYRYFTTKKASKAEFAQELAANLEEHYADKPKEIKKVLPKYLVEAIEYVTEAI